MDRRASLTGGSISGRPSLNGSVSTSTLGTRPSSQISKLKLACASFMERDHLSSQDNQGDHINSTRMRLQYLANQVVSSEAVLRQLEEALELSRATKLSDRKVFSSEEEPDASDSEGERELGPWAGSKRAQDRPARPQSDRPRRLPARRSSAHRMRARALRAAASAAAGAAPDGTAADAEAAAVLLTPPVVHHVPVQHAPVFKMSVGAP